MAYEWIDNYILEKTGVEKDYKEEWQWHRYLLRNKMLAAVCGDSDGKQMITLKCEPSFGEYLRETYSDITPGYYMNKVHWNSVDLSGEVPEEVLKTMIDQSYTLILNGFSKKIQKEILG